MILVDANLLIYAIDHESSITAKRAHGRFDHLDAEINSRRHEHCPSLPTRRGGATGGVAAVRTVAPGFNRGILGPPIS
jgi:hypothetical protein